MGRSMAAQHRVCVETPESRNQVHFHWDGVLEVHGDVVFGANDDVWFDGAVSLPLEIGFHLPFVTFCDAVVSFGWICRIGCPSQSKR